MRSHGFSIATTVLILSSSMFVLSVTIPTTADMGGRSAPTVTCDLLPTSYYKKGTTVIFSGTAYDDGNILTLEITTNAGILWSNITSFYQNNTGQYFWSWKTANEDPGTHQVSIRAVDDERRSGVVPLTVILDDDDPVIAIDEPADDPSIMPLGDTITISGTVVDASTSIVDLNISVDGGDEWIELIDDIKGSTWSYDWVTNPTDRPTTYDIMLEATDRVGNLGSASLEIILSDLRPPVAALTDPAELDQITEWDSLTIKGTANDDVGITSLTMEVPGKSQPVNIINRLYAGSWSWTWDASDMVPDDYTITLTAKDARGNTAVASSNFSLIDEELPSVDIKGPVLNAILKNGKPVSIWGKATDNTGIESLYLIVDSDPQIDITKDLNSRYEFTYSLAGLKNGKHTLVIKAIDLSGQSAQSSVDIRVIPKDQTSNTSMAAVAGAIGAIVAVFLILFILLWWKGKLPFPKRSIPGTSTIASPPPPQNTNARQQDRPLPPPPPTNMYQSGSQWSGPTDQGYNTPSYDQNNYEGSMTDTSYGQGTYDGSSADMDRSPIETGSEIGHESLLPPPPTQESPRSVSPPIEEDVPPPSDQDDDGFEAPPLSDNPEQAPHECTSCGLDIDYEILVCPECGARLY